MWLRPKHVFLALNFATYFSLLYLGCYFIAKVDVLERFQHKKTNLAEYTERMLELPTISTWKKYSKKYAFKPKFGEDFNITYQSPTWKKSSETTLREGENRISGLRVLLEISYNKWWQETMTITPLNFRHNMALRPIDFKLRYIFKNQTVASMVSEVKLALTTRNNSYCGTGFDGTFDGNIFETFSKPSMSKLITVIPKKFLHLKEVEKCREEPYSDVLLRQTLKDMKKNCSIACRPKSFFLCNRAFKEIPVCKNATGTKCFYARKNSVPKTILKKPCTKLQYEVMYQEENYLDWNNIGTIGTSASLVAEFSVQYPNPPRVTVKEEYLIFDLVSLISAIGGTMGLCIGFSFVDVTRFLLKQIEDGFYHVKDRFHSGNQKVESTQGKKTFDDLATMQDVNQMKLEMDEKLRRLKAMLYTFKHEENKAKHS